MSKVTRIALVGASGMVGTALISLAVGRPDLRIVAVARRELNLPDGARMEVLLADPANWGDAIAATGADVLVSALGTTWRKSGKDEAAFRAIDETLVLDCAKAAKAAGMRQMIAISSVGADPAAKNFYLRVKGEAEQKLTVAVAEAAASALRAKADGEAYANLKVATAQADALKIQNAALAQNKDVLVHTASHAPCPAACATSVRALP